MNRGSICEILGVGDVLVPCKYLRISMNAGIRKIEVFNYLSDRVRQKLQGWKNKSFSKACDYKEIATQSIFWMNFLLIPNKVCTIIQRQKNDYWWGSGGSSKGMRWISLEKIYDVKEGGGLGFKELSKFIIAMLVK